MRFLPLSLTSHIQFPSFTSFLSLSWSRPSTTLLGIFTFFFFCLWFCTILQPPLPSCILTAVRVIASLSGTIVTALFSWFPSGYRGKSLWYNPWLRLSSLESFWTNAYKFQATPGIFCSPRFSSNSSLWLESLFHTTHLLNALASRITSSVKLPWQRSAPSSLSTSQESMGPPLGPGSATPNTWLYVAVSVVTWGLGSCLTLFSFEILNKYQEPVTLRELKYLLNENVSYPGIVFHKSMSHSAVFFFSAPFPGKMFNCSF